MYRITLLNGPAEPRVWHTEEVTRFGSMKETPFHIGFFSESQKWIEIFPGTGTLVIEEFDPEERWRDLETLMDDQ